MPKKPENRRKPGGYLSKANVDNALDEIGTLENMIDILLCAEQQAVRQVAVKGNKSLRALKNELIELKQILNNK